MLFRSTQDCESSIDRGHRPATERQRISRRQRRPHPHGVSRPAKTPISRCGI